MWSYTVTSSPSPQAGAAEPLNFPQSTTVSVTLSANGDGFGVPVSVLDRLSMLSEKAPARLPLFWMSTVPV